MSSTTTTTAPAAPRAAPAVGALRLAPYLNFDGAAREAMTFYQQCVGGELAVTTFGDADPTAPAEMSDRVLNARLEAGAFGVMASDTPVYGAPFVRGNNVHLNVECASDAAVDALYAALAENGQATVPPHDAFWGARFGMLTDRYGVQWMLNHGRSA
jgi:PhnB protein